MSRLHKQAMRVLIADITRGVYSEGDRLPREVDIAEQFEISRGVAREVIRGLEERGLIKVTHGRGASVRPRSNWDMFDPDVLAAVVNAPESGNVLADYVECRRIIEVEAAGLAAERATDANLEALGEAFEKMKVAAERARKNPEVEHLYIEADIGFHRAVIDSTQNAALGQVTEPIHRALATALQAWARPAERFTRGLPEHEEILTAITHHDREAARGAMARHLATVREHLEDYRASGGDGRRKRRRRRTAAKSAS